jgi:hypothetical protein
MLDAVFSVECASRLYNEDHDRVEAGEYIRTMTARVRLKKKTPVVYLKGLGTKTN